MSALLQLSPAFPSADLESKTLQGVKGELSLDRPGQHHLENTTLDFQKLSDKEILRIAGPLGADFTVKVRAYVDKCSRARVLNKVISCTQSMGSLITFKISFKL